MLSDHVEGVGVLSKMTAMTTTRSKYDDYGSGTRLAVSFLRIAGTLLFDGHVGINWPQMA